MDFEAFEIIAGVLGVCGLLILAGAFAIGSAWIKPNKKRQGD